MNHTEILDTLQLIRSEHVGAVTYHQLVAYYGSAAAALEALPELAARGGGKRKIVRCERSAAEAEYEAIERFGAKLVPIGSDDYPERLAQVHDAPPLLIALGDVSRLHATRMIGVVGARNASANGFAFARKLAADLSARAYVIASGLARGIDTAAHQGSLQGGTVAVVAGGVDHIYPPENEALYRAIAERGCIITEAPFGTAPIARHFPARNRIIAGMAKALVVMEASQKSGSLITAHNALDYGREVFAVPGSPMDPRCHGSNDLIRQGATLIQSANDVLAELEAPVLSLLEPPAPPWQAIPQPPDDDEMTQTRTKLLEKLGAEPVLLDELLLQCHVGVGAMHRALLELELAGRLVRHAGGKVSLALEAA